jgi:beta-glucanase (GH16 family)
LNILFASHIFGGEVSEPLLKEIPSSNTLIDNDTPADAQPFIRKGKDLGGSFKLIFSDEFNGEKVNDAKWSIQDRIVRKRHEDLISVARKSDVTQHNGMLNIHYSRDKKNLKEYHAGRVDSKGKFSVTYGYMECKVKVVNPSGGYQTAFWMMPEGDGMRNATKPTGTAHNGAEIDIFESNKKKTFSCGIHWDGYGKAHRSNGSKVSAKNLYDSKYHVFGFAWDKDSLRWYYDGVQVREVKNKALIPHVDHFLYISGMCFGSSTWVVGDIRKNKLIENGGTDTSFVEYVRVYKKRGK